MSTPAAPFTTKPRPEFRNIHVTQLLAYRLPASGMVSIMHRVSGALLFLALPLLLWTFELSLISETGFARLAGIGSHWLTKIVGVVLAWAFFHHLVAGVRYLLLDLDIGVEKAHARKSALTVYAISLPLTLMVALRIFGAF